MSKVSILVPIYKVEDYIEKCVVSLMEQTYDNIEYVFVDDCTSDNSIKILNEVINRYPTRRKNVQVIKHKINRGLAAARNTALESSTGEYIFHVDSDDWIHPNCITKLVERAVETNADIVDSGYVDVHLGNTKSVIPEIYSENKYIKVLLAGIGISSNRIWGRLIKRSLYFDHNIKAIDGVNYGEDYSVITRLLYYGKRSYVNDLLYYYNHLNENSYMHNLSQANFNSLVRSKLFVANYFLSEINRQEYNFVIHIGLICALKKGKDTNLDFSDLQQALNDEKLHVISKVLYISILRGYTSISKLLISLIRNIIKYG